MLVLYEVVEYLCLEMGICVIYINEIMPQGLSDDQNLQNAHNMETVYPITKQQGPYCCKIKMNLMKNKQCIYENSAHLYK